MAIFGNWIKWKLSIYHSYQKRSTAYYSSNQPSISMLEGSSHPSNDQFVLYSKRTNPRNWDVQFIGPPVDSSFTYIAIGGALTTYLNFIFTIVPRYRCFIFHRSQLYRDIYISNIYILSFYYRYRLGPKFIKNKHSHFFYTSWRDLSSTLTISL